MVGISENPPKTPSKSQKRRALYLALEVSLVVVVVALLSLVRARNDVSDFYPYGDSCQNNLKQLCLVFTMYAEEHSGLFPELSPEPGTLAVREDLGYPGVRPQFLTDTSFLTCPTARVLRPRRAWFGEEPPPPPFLDLVSNDLCYLYLGYVIPDQTALEHFAEAYRAHVAAGKPFDKDLAAERDDGTALVIPRLRKGIPGVTDTDKAQSTIPVFVERYPPGHIPGGANVVYLDGRAEWIKWGEQWPMTPEAMDVLLALDTMGEAP